MKTQTQESQAALTPEDALQLLKDGNDRFVSGNMAERDLMAQVRDTASGQFPFATVLGCLDSRVSAEIVFDQGIGDVFSGRVAGNIANQDILGSMEFACKLAGTKIIVVLGHTSCGAVKGACDDAQLGNLTWLLSKIRPAVDAVAVPVAADQRTSANTEFVNAVALKNVELTVANIRKLSPVLAEMENNGEIMIIGAMYDISSGAVTFL